MSAASITSGDENAYIKVFQRGGGNSGQAHASSSSSGRNTGGGRSRAATSQSTASNSGASNGGGSEKPSAIPRPSLNYSRPNLEQTPSSSSARIAEPAAKVHVEPKKQQKARPARSRTYSQPYNIINATEASTSSGVARANGAATRKTTVNNGSSLPTPASSRSNSPALPSSSPSDVRAPKVTKSRSKTQPPNGSSSNRAPLLTPERSPNVWQAKTSLYADPHYASSLSSISVTSTNKAGQNMTEIMYEMPPFSANSHTSSIQDDSHDVNEYPRPSTEEERPFEHWYRGDLSRNGGVGELRVGNRMEMLEIANYGHRLREKQLAAAALNNTRTAAFQGRKRAESIGHRDSVFYEDEDGRMVMDETPLTDMEADTEVETDREAGEETWDDHETQETSKVSTSTERQSTPTNVPRHNESISQSQIPRPSIRAMSESPQSSSVSASRQQQYANAVPQSQSLTLSISTSTNKHHPAQKRSRTKSPVPSTSTPTTSTPTAKKLKVSTVVQKRSKSNVRPSEADRSTAEYPEPPDGPGGMADAIPSWTRPKPKGNWDEVCSSLLVCPLYAQFRVVPGCSSCSSAEDGSRRSIRRSYWCS